VQVEGLKAGGPCCARTPVAAEILHRLWRSEQDEQLERMAQADSNASGVVKAFIWSKNNFDDPFSIRPIAEETNMSPSERT